MRSKRGVGGLANTAPRFEEAILMQMPTATKYDLRKQFDMRPNKTPFNVKSAQRPRTVNKNPGLFLFTIILVFYFIRNKFPFSKT